MRKIGILFGAENTFPGAVVEAINAREADGIQAEFVHQGAVRLDQPPAYAVIIDRISHEVPFYRAFLKHAALHGAAVLNNPFWWSADDKFLNYALAAKLGVSVPHTALLPQKRLRNGDERLLRNLEYPLDWDSLFDYVGFPAYLKPIDGGGWRNIHRVHSREEFFHAYDHTGEICMVLQQAIEHTGYYRCLVIGDKVRIAAYDPHANREGRYAQDAKSPAPALANRLEEDALHLCSALGYACNTVEFAVKGGVPYAIDFMNPAADLDLHSIGREHFDWAVNALADLAIEKALAHGLKDTVPFWSHLLQPEAPAKATRTAAAKKTAAKKATAAKSAEDEARPAKKAESGKTAPAKFPAKKSSR